MKNLKVLLVLFTFSAGYGQNNNFVMIIQEGRTFWPLTKSICSSQLNMIEKGVYFGPDNSFDWYKITDENDTLSLGDGMDWNINVDRCSYDLREDTLFVIRRVIAGCCTPRPDSYDTISDTIYAYKIIYTTEQKLVLLDLTKDSLSGWVEYRDPICNKLNILEFNHADK
jgi:hypothetical protein